MHFANGPPIPNFAFKEHQSLARRLHQQIVEDHSQKIFEQRRHIFGAISFAQRSWWDLDDLSQLHGITQVLRIAYLTDGATQKTLRYHRSYWLAGVIERGLQEVGVESLGREEIRFGS